MRRTKKMSGEDASVKKITIRRQTKKTSFVIQYYDGRRIETPYVEIQGSATLYLDPVTKEPTLRTEANVNLGRNSGTCVVCGEDADDLHAHA